MYYPGGKGQFYQKFINLMPPHEVYIESHLGGGAVLLKKRRAKKNIGIEIDPNVIKRWSTTPQKNLELIHADAVEYLKRYHFTGKELVYCDPPYLRVHL
jgi:site-specific DNA-adenine methylase